LAHEIGHIVHRDSYLAMRVYQSSQTKKLYTHLASIPLDFWPYGMGVGSGESALVISALDRPMAELALSGYRNEVEPEAELFAIDQFTRSGRDVRQILRAFELTTEPMGADPFPTFHSRPNNDRKTYLEAAIGKVPAPPSEDGGYLTRMEGAIRQNIHLDIANGRFRSALRGAKRLAVAHPDHAEDLYLEAEAYRRLGPRPEVPAQAELEKTAQREAKKREATQTEDEIFRALAATAGGKSAMQANQAKAEALFRSALRMDATLAAAHLGLGMLYEQQSQPKQARQEYLQYLGLTPMAQDRARVQRRVEALDRSPNK
jgi:tetratricopeptide (TPR) repeat protein